MQEKGLGFLLCVALLFLFMANLANSWTIGNVSSWWQQSRDIIFQIDDGSRLCLSVLAPDLIRVRFAPDGVIRGNISRAVVKDDWPIPNFTVQDTGGYITVATNEIFAQVQKTPCVLAFWDRVGNMLLSDDPTRRIQWSSTYTRVYKTTQSDEYYLSLGWRPLPLVRNGTKFRMRNVPTYDDPELFYGGIPFWYGIRNGIAYGVFFDDTSWGEIDLGQASSEYMFFGNLGGQVDYYFFYGPQISKILDRYTELTGRPYMPPKWACGYQQSRWSYTPQSEVLSIANELRVRNIPCDVIYLDIDYMYPGWQLTFNSSTFPDPAGMCAALHSQGFHIVANISPWLLRDDPRRPYAESQGYFLTYGGSTYWGWHDYVYFIMGAMGYGMI